MITLIRRFHAATSGLAALEFALVIPMMLAFFVGAIEVSNGMVADRRVTLATSTLADLAAQDICIDNTERTNILAAGKAVMSPVNTGDMGMRVTSVVADAAGATKVAWSEASTGRLSPYAKDTLITLPAGMVAPNSSVIFAEVELGYRSNIGDLMNSGVTIKDRFYLRPRRANTVMRMATCP